MICGNLPSVGVHGGEEVDPGGVHQGGHLLVPGKVGGADVVSKVQQQLPAQNLGRGNGIKIFIVSHPFIMEPNRQVQTRNWKT